MEQVKAAEAHRYFENYGQFKAEFDREIGRQAAGFVRMGYLLKVARDTNILYESGYRSIAEFAKAEYGLSDDTVSRMIAINDRYSEGGYSEVIADRYSGFGTSLLAEMLTLSDQVIDALPDGITRADIRAVKAEIREEGKITDLEVMMEEKGQPDLDSNLARVLHQYYHENSRQYIDLDKAVREQLTPEKALELLAPSGIGVKMARVSGMGKFMLSIKGLDQPLELVNVRTNETEKYTWSQCMLAMAGLCAGSGNMKKDWEACYGEPFPEERGNGGKEELAPAQEAEKKEAPQSRTALEDAREQTETEQEQAETEQERAETERDQGKQEQKTDQEEPAPGEQMEDRSEMPAVQEQESWTEAQQAKQSSIEDMPDILPENYMPMPEEYEEERSKWATLKESALKIYNTLDAYEFAPDERTRKLLESIRDTMAGMDLALDALNMSDAWGKV